MSVRRLRALTLAPILCVAFTACGRSPAPSPEPALVRTVAASRGPLTRWLSLTGRVAPRQDRDALLAPLVAGRLTEVAVREGDLVRKGQIVASVEAGSLEDALAGAEAASDRASRDARLHRSVATASADLLAKGVISREQADADEAAAVSADAGQVEAGSLLKTARRHVEWATLRAPFDGAILRILRRKGETVDGTQGTPVVEIAAPQPWEAEAAATAEQLDAVREGQRGEIVLGSETPSSPAIAASVAQVGRSIDAATGAGEVRLRPVGDARSLPLGASIGVRIALEAKESVLVVPKAALRAAQDGGTEIVVVQGGTAHVRAVTTGIAEGDRVEIVSGVDEGARVVVEDPLALADGAAVRERT